MQDKQVITYSLHMVSLLLTLNLKELLPDQVIMHVPTHILHYSTIVLCYHIKLLNHYNNSQVLVITKNKYGILACYHRRRGAGRVDDYNISLVASLIRPHTGLHSLSVELQLSLHSSLSAK